MPALVTNDYWSISTTKTSGVQGYILNVYEVNRNRRGEGDGQVFDTREKAEEFCLEKGYLELFVKTQGFQILFSYFVAEYGYDEARKKVLRDYGEEASDYI